VGVPSRKRVGARAAKAETKALLCTLVEETLHCESFPVDFGRWKEII
jgi:hypothetical protein